jgi:hypothetical protein
MLLHMAGPVGPDAERDGAAERAFQPLARKKAVGKPLENIAQPEPGKWLNLRLASYCAASQTG